jgi:Spindle and kinetochore-associated protein 1
VQQQKNEPEEVDCLQQFQSGRYDTNIGFLIDDSDVASLLSFFFPTLAFQCAKKKLWFSEQFLAGQKKFEKQKKTFEKKKKKRKEKKRAADMEDALNQLVKNFCDKISDVELLMSASFQYDRSREEKQVEVGRYAQFDASLQVAERQMNNLREYIALEMCFMAQAKELQRLVQQQENFATDMTRALPAEQRSTVEAKQRKRASQRMKPSIGDRQSQGSNNDHGDRDNDDDEDEERGDDEEGNEEATEESDDTRADDVDGNNEGSHSDESKDADNDDGDNDKDDDETESSLSNERKSRRSQSAAAIARKRATALAARRRAAASKSRGGAAQPTRRSTRLAVAGNGKADASDENRNNSGNTAAPAAERPKKSAATSKYRIAHVSDEEMASLSNYMRGRLTADRVNDIADKFSEIVDHKYTILRTPTRRMSEAMLAEYQKYAKNETERTRRQVWFCDIDIKLHGGIKMDASMRSTLMILRHLGRLSQDNKRYIVVKRS